MNRRWCHYDGENYRQRSGDGSHGGTSSRSLCYSAVELAASLQRTSLPPGLEAAFRPKPQTPWTTQPVTAPSRAVRAGPFLPGQDASKGSSGLVLYLPAETFLRAALSLWLFPPFPSVFPLFFTGFRWKAPSKGTPFYFCSPLSLTGVSPYESLALLIPPWHLHLRNMN